MTRRERAAEQGPVPWVTIAATVVVLATFVAELSRGIDAWRPSASQLAAIGGGAGAGVTWRLALAPLVHVGVVHLAFNVIGLVLVVPPIERAAGRATALVVLAGGAAAGAALHLARQPYDLSVGASGATFAAAAALLVLVMSPRRGAAPKAEPRVREASRERGDAIRLAVFVALNVAAGLAAALADVGAAPDGWAHLGGAAAGAAIALCAGPRPAPLRTIAAAIAIGLATAAVLALATPAIDYRAELAGAAQLEQTFDQVVPETISGPELALAERVRPQLIAPADTLIASLGVGDARMPDAIAKRRAALRAYLEARRRAFVALEALLTAADANARADFDAANRDADRALAAP